jgi:hypothetical protein
MKPLIPILIAIGVAVGIIIIMVIAIPYQEEQQQKKLAQEKSDECTRILLTFDVAGNLNPKILENNQKILKLHDKCKQELNDIQLEGTGWKRIP